MTFKDLQAALSAALVPMNTTVSLTQPASDVRLSWFEALELVPELAQVCDACVVAVGMYTVRGKGFLTFHPEVREGVPAMVIPV